MNHAVGFSVTQEVRVPLDAVWNVLGDFGTEHRWTRTLAACERDTPQVAIGTVRTCTLPKPLMGRTVAREELTEFEPGKALGYRLDGPAGPFVTAASRWSTKATPDGRTEITVEGRFTTGGLLARAVMWPLAKPMIKRLTRRVLRELEGYVLAQQQR